jgi:hypothetical protein
MLCTYLADRGALHKTKLGLAFGLSPFDPCLNFRLIQGGKFAFEGKAVFTLWNWRQQGARGIAFAQLSRSTGEDRIGQKPFLHRGSGKSILTQSPERFRP